MVLYYLNASQEPEDIKSPNAYLAFHCGMKNLQLGMIAGCALGGLAGLVRKNWRAGTLFTDMTHAIGAGGLLGGAYGAAASLSLYCHFFW